MPNRYSVVTTLPEVRENIYPSVLGLDYAARIMQQVVIVRVWSDIFFR